MVQIQIDQIHRKERTELTSHTYNEETANAIISAILERYVAEFIVFRQTMEDLEEQELA